MKRNYKLFIQDIIDAMETIEKFVGNMKLDELKADEKTSSAVLMKFEIIGEAAKYMPDKVKDKNILESINHQVQILLDF